MRTINFSVLSVLLASLLAAPTSARSDDRCPISGHRLQQVMTKNSFEKFDGVAAVAQGQSVFIRLVVDAWMPGDPAGKLSTEPGILGEIVLENSGGQNCGAVTTARAMATSHVLVVECSVINGKTDPVSFNIKVSPTGAGTEKLTIGNGRVDVCYANPKS